MRNGSIVKTIVIVGASSGLGKSLALLLHKKGAKLFLLSRKINQVNFLRERIEKIPCDMTQPKSIKLAFKKLEEKTKRIDVFVNCVGIALEERLDHSSERKIENVIRTNLTGAILANREVYRRMLKQRSGHIINISSTSGKKARPLETVYCASKWGLAGFSESLRLEAREYGIRVSTVYPGGMKTLFYSTYPKKDIKSFMDPDDVAEQIVCLISSNPNITPSELVIERSRN